jgi:hypothetical protein
LSLTILETILKWSESCPLWQRDALRRLIIKGELEEEDILELLELCKVDAGIATKSGILAEPLEKAHISTKEGEQSKITLLEVSDVKNVNLINSKQPLTLQHEGVTIIYGSNGSGKSGYSRVIKAICRARKREEILPNAYEELPTDPASAKISFAINGSAKSYDWTSDGSTSVRLVILLMPSSYATRRRIAASMVSSKYVWPQQLPDHTVARFSCGCCAVEEEPFPHD